MDKIIELTPRLQQVATFVPLGSRFADIGTDHAFLPVYLLQTQKICSAIAADIRTGPLNRAKSTGVRYDIGSQLEYRLCDGLVGIHPHEVDTIAIAGMGGETIIHILSQSPWSLGKTLILQPMSTQPELRQYLWEQGVSILQEQTICEGDALYTILLVQAGPQAQPTTPELWAGRQWKGMIDPLRPLLLEKLIEKLSHALEGMEGSNSPRTTQRRSELTQIRTQLIEMEEEWNTWQL